jgi:hypothetical protein
LHAHAELSHSGCEFSEDEKISMLIQSVMNHKHAIQLMHKIDNEHEKGIDFQLIVNRIIKDYEQLTVNRHSSQVQDRLANQALTADELSIPDPHDSETDTNEGHWAHINQMNHGESLNQNDLPMSTTYHRRNTRMQKLRDLLIFRLHHSGITMKYHHQLSGFRAPTYMSPPWPFNRAGALPTCLTCLW